MNIHEYQAKEILSRLGMRIPRGRVAFTAKEAEVIAQSIGPGPFVVKAQIHAGGRGKSGGIRLAKNPVEARQIAWEMIGMRLATPQTGPEGKPVSRVLIEETIPIAREFYLGVTIDRKLGKVVVVGCAEGGVDIEEVAARSPEKIQQIYAEAGCGITQFQGRKIALAMGLEGGIIGKAATIVSTLYQGFMEYDCTLAEINPLVLTEGGDLLALDAKMNIDDNALYRHPDYSATAEDSPLPPPGDPGHARCGTGRFPRYRSGALGFKFRSPFRQYRLCRERRGPGHGDPGYSEFLRRQTSQFPGCGGRGFQGGHPECLPASFLRPPGERNPGEHVRRITRCDSYAEGIVEALRAKPLTIPLVVRLEGTNVELGRKILAESGLDILYAGGMREAAQKIIQLVKGDGG